MNYSQALSYLNSFINYERIDHYPYKDSFKIERIIDFFKILNNLQDNLKVIHVAGTKGKGSTASFVAHILKEANFKVGLYTSPHLIDFRERIRVLDKKNSSFDEFEGKINESDVCDLVNQLKPKIDNFNNTSKHGRLTFFEVFTILAFVYFKRQEVDFAVLETGMGGRLDATNVSNSIVCGISPISLEHTRFLGTSLAEIAEEKGGIIKKGSIVVSSPQEVEVENALRKRAEILNAKFYMIGRDLPFEIVESNLNEQKFNFKGIFNTYKDLRVMLKGEFQIINASLAVALIDALNFHKINIREQDLREGLYKTQWPGRFEIVSQRPLVILDGAQNVHSIRALMDSIKKYFDNRNIILLLGISSDKDIKGICSIFKKSVKDVILTKANNPRATEPKQIERIGELKDVRLTDSVEGAINLAMSSSGDNDLILVTGSLFVVGEAKKYLGKEKLYAVK